MDRRSLIKSIGAIPGIPAIIKSEVIEYNSNKPKLLIISFQDHLEYESYTRIKQFLENQLPGWKVIILDQGAKFEVRDV